MSKTVLFVDTEGDFCYNVPSPHFKKFDIIKWYINSFLGKLFRYPNPTRNGLINIVKTLKTHSFKAFFCIAGHLFLKECTGDHDKNISPKNSWFIDKIGKNWYYWDRGGNFKTNPGVYYGDFIEKEMKGNKLFTFGLHGFAHEALTLENKETVENIINEGIKHAKKLGIKIEAFAAPFNMIEDINEPNKVFDILKKKGIKHIQYAGEDNRFVNLHKKGLLIKNKNGLIIYGVTHAVEGTHTWRSIKNMVKDINSMQEKGIDIVIMTHDFTWKNINKFEYFVKGINK